MKNVIGIWILMSLSLLGTCTPSFGQCYQMDSKDYFDIRSKGEMNAQVQKELETMHGQFGKVD